MPVHPRQILWPTDFSTLSFHGARYARGFCETFDARLYVVHVVAPPLGPDIGVTIPVELPPDQGDEELVAGCRESLDDVVRQRFAGLSDVARDVVVGNPWSTICTYAHEHDVDLIVVTTHGRTGLRHVLIGSTAERIVQHAPCPVLVVKNPEKDFVSE